MINRIVVHISDSRFGNSALITTWHIARGWKNIGYHQVILNGWLSSKHYRAAIDGSIETGRPLDDNDQLEGEEIGAHVTGFNSDSIGICVISDGKISPTAKQLASLKSLLDWYRTKYTNIKIVGHSDLDNKKPNCPGKHIMNWLKENNYHE